MVNTDNLSHEMKVFYHQYRKMLAINRLKRLIEKGKIMFPNDESSLKETRSLSDSALTFAISILPHTILDVVVCICAILFVLLSFTVSL
jgi:hypothetical protein